MPTAVVTGVTGALGGATARELADRGWSVVTLARDPKRAPAIGETVECDFASLASVKAAAAEIARRQPAIQALVHVAAVYKQTRATTKDGYESMFGVNHLAPFALTLGLLDALKKGAPARVVTVSAPSSTALDFEDLQGEKKWSAFTAFGRSKAANLMFTGELARRLDGTGVVAHAFHPGLMKSELMKEAAAPVRFLLGLVSKSPQQAARALADVATTPPFGDSSGKFFHWTKEIAIPKTPRDPAAQKRLWEESEKLVSARA